jgi:hypothetical protein
MGLSATSASAATEVKTVKGEVIFAHGQRPTDPGNCSAIVFVQWADQPGTVSAKAFYTWKGKEYSKVAESPFNDTYEWVATYTVPPGQHWIQVGKGWRDGPGVDTCEDAAAQRVHRQGEAQAARQAGERQGQARQGGQARGRGLLTATAGRSGAPPMSRLGA